MPSKKIARGISDQNDTADIMNCARDERWIKRGQQRCLSPLPRPIGRARLQTKVKSVSSSKITIHLSRVRRSPRGYLITAPSGFFQSTKSPPVVSRYRYAGSFPMRFVPRRFCHSVNELLESASFLADAIFPESRFESRESRATACESRG